MHAILKTHYVLQEPLIVSNKCPDHCNPSVHLHCHIPVTSDNVLTHYRLPHVDQGLISHLLCFELVEIITATPMLQHFHSILLYSVFLFLLICYLDLQL